jgi:hypothetical protein
MGELGDSAPCGSEIDRHNIHEGSGAPAADSTAEANRVAKAKRWQLIACLGLCALTLIAVLPPIFAWQSDNQQKALSLSNMRRVANGCLIYAQDWDLRMPPPSQRLSDGFVLSWPRLVRPYVLLDDAFTNPSNPVKPFPRQATLRDPTDNRPIETSYALNRRFWGEFGAGPFPLGNLEIPEQTVLVAEAGRMAADPRHPRLAGSEKSGFALDLYGDTTDRVRGLSPYPSTHAGEFGAVAADGHGVMLQVLYYGPTDGPHDKRLGRLGKDMYNWNGGHDNGETDRPAHE